MRAYTRNDEQRLADQIAVSGILSRAEAPSESRTHTGPSFWSRFTQVLEDAVRGSDLRERHSMLRLARCGRLDLTQVFDCGAEEEAVEAWCGHPYCPACVDATTARAARAARESWPERVLTVEIPIGMPGGIELPSPEAVATVREAWGRITKRAAELTGLERLDAIPRAIVHPDGLTAFLELPWSVTNGTWIQRPAEEGLVTAIRRAAREAGLRDTRARVGSREAAALELRAAQSLESHRFQERVARDLERLEAFAWRREFPSDASLAALVRATARQWTTRLRATHKTLRRSRSLGGKRSLPVTRPGEPSVSKRRCPDHGGRCRIATTRIRDRAQAGRVVRELQGEAFSGEFNRQRVAAFLDDTRPEPIKLEVVLPQRLRRVA